MRGIFLCLLITYKINFFRDSSVSNEYLVSCLCVTRNRVQMLRRVISCFLNQTYQHRELVVVYEADDSATRDYLATLKDLSIRPIEVASSPKLSLGALRNISIQASCGHYIAQWDDDDWYAPTRLAEQIGAIRESGKRGCVLLRWVMYDEATETAYLSGSRAWEGSIVAEKSAMPPYPDLRKGEDTSVIKKMALENKLVGLERPLLYIYTYHGANTWERSHWENNLLPHSKHLTPEYQERIRSQLLR
jgi:glycosyltransferase involved in cell wall biosynthesis